MSTSGSAKYGAATTWATRIAFSINGFGIAAWAPLVPYVKLQAGVDERQLGLLLLCMGLGSILCMPLAGAMASKTGCRQVIVFGVLGMCVALPLLAFTSDPRLLALVLFLFGAAFGAEGVAMNMQAVLVETVSEKSMMSGFHGFYSLGGIFGALVVSVLLGVKIAPFFVAAIVALIILIFLLIIWQALIPAGVGKRGPVFAWPKGKILVIGIICFITFLVEGSVLDWSAIQLTDFRKATPSEAGLGYAAFALAMTVGRFWGDRAVQFFGGIRVSIYGCLIAALGFFLSVHFYSMLWVGLVGFGLVGLGCSNIVPIMYSLTGKQTSVPQSVAIPAISTMGYAGILVGPSIIGFIAHTFQLDVALLGISVLLLALMVLIATMINKP